MNKDNSMLIQALINIAAEELENKLPDSPNHPDGRNPHAHIASVLRSILGHSYTECSDEQIPALKLVIEQIKNCPF